MPTGRRWRRSTASPRRHAHRERPVCDGGLAPDICRASARARGADQAGTGEGIAMATTQSVIDGAISLARSRRQQDLDDLIEELSIPSISTLPERREDCLRNARWLRDRFEKMGMQAQIVDVLDGGLPVVVADWNGAPGDRKSVV